METFKKSETLFIDGVHVYYECYQGTEAMDCPTILLIHGFVSSTFSYRLLFPYLGERYRVIAVDLPGFGQSEKSKTFIYSFESYAALLVKMLNILGVTKSVVIGHSMGGQVALYMARKHPVLIEKLVLLSSSGYLKRVKRRYVFASYLPFSHKIMQFCFEHRDYKRALSHVVYNKTKVDNTIVKEYTKAFLEKGFYHSLVRLMRHREGDLPKEELKKIIQPTLILWGAEDEIIPAHIGKRLNQDIPNSKLFIYSKTGHLLPEERPKEVGEKIIEFIKE